MKMIEVFKFRNRILKEYLILCTILVSFFIVLGQSKMAYGFIFGAFISGVSFYLISITNIQIFFSGNKNSYNSKIIKWFLLRYLLYALCLVIAFKKPFFDFGATVIGLFSIQFTIIFSKIILRET